MFSLVAQEAARWIDLGHRSASETIRHFAESHFAPAIESAASGASLLSNRWHGQVSPDVPFLAYPLR
jgi:hypothetical protein